MGGGHGGQLGQLAQLRGGALFLFLLFFFYSSSILPFLLAIKDFAKIMPLAKIISKKYIALPKKRGEAFGKVANFIN